jgi:uncharacterized protein (TIGR04255 family)
MYTCAKDSALLRLLGRRAVKPHRLENAPIVEALVEFRVEPRTDLGIQDLKTLAFDGYPQREDRVDVTAEVQFQEGMISTAHNRRPSGFLAWNLERDRCVNASLRSFSFSRLRPYDSWEALRTEAEILWLEYCRVAKPVRVKRIGVRYINRLLVPRQEPLGDYLRTLPCVSADLPQHFEGLLMRLVLVSTEHRAKATVMQAFEESSDPTVQPVIFDIDAYRETDLEPGNQAWEVAEILRQLKNEVFFFSLRERALQELFK